MAFLTLAALGASAIGSVARGSAARSAAFKQRQHERDLAYKASSFFSDDAVDRSFRSNQDRLGLQGILSDVALSGRQSATALRSGIERQLGGTLLGQSQAAGAEAGASFRSNVIRSKLNAEAMGLTFEQQARAQSPFLTLLGRGTQGPMQPTNFLSSAVEGLGTGLQAADMIRRMRAGSSTGGGNSSLPLGAQGPLNQGENPPFMSLGR